MADIKLVSYIKENLAKGYTKEELKQILKENGWSAVEVDEAFEALEKPAQPIQNQQRATTVPSELVFFVKQAFDRGYDQNKIYEALNAKGWPKDIIGKAIGLAKPKTEYKPQQQIKQVIQQQPAQQQKVKVQKQREPTQINGKKILYYGLSSVVLFIILFLTVGLYYNVVGLTTYSITDPSTSQVYYGRCLTADCAAMKDFAWQNVTSNLWMIIGLSAGLTILGVLLYSLIPRGRSITVWSYNIAYLLFLIFIGFIWFRFNSSIQ